MSQDNSGNGTGSANSNFLLNQFSAGQITAMRKPQRTPPAWERKIIIGQDRDLKYHTELKVYVHKPTPRFPSSSVIFQINNAKSSCFVRVNDPVELESVAKFLKECAGNVKDVITEQMPLVEAALQAQEQWNKAQEQIEAMQKMQATMERE